MSKLWNRSIVTKDGKSIELQAQHQFGSGDSLEDLEDVDITNPQIGQVIKWNGQKWVNANESGGGGQYVLPVASSEVLGGIKVGSNLSIDENGALSAPAPTPQYTLPTASAETLGGVKVGSGLSIDENGVLSASGGGGGGLTIGSHTFFSPINGIANDVTWKVALTSVITQLEEYLSTKNSSYKYQIADISQGNLIRHPITSEEVFLPSITFALNNNISEYDDSANPLRIFGTSFDPVDANNTFMGMLIDFASYEGEVEVACKVIKGSNDITQNGIGGNAKVRLVINEFIG